MLTNCGCDIELAFDECSELKLFVKRNPYFRALHPLNLWQKISRADCERNLKVVHLPSMYPLASAACDLGCSTLKRT